MRWCGRAQRPRRRAARPDAESAPDAVPRRSRSSSAGLAALPARARPALGWVGRVARRRGAENGPEARTVEAAWSPCPQYQGSSMNQRLSPTPGRACQARATGETLAGRLSPQTRLGADKMQAARGPQRLPSTRADQEDSAVTQGFVTPEAGGGQGGSPLRHEAGPSDSESRGPARKRTWGVVRPAAWPTGAIRSSGSVIRPCIRRAGAGHRS